MNKLSRCLIVFILLLTFNNLNAINYYWVGGSGNWSDINRWATTSGGTTKHIVVPSPDDNVIFDANSFSASGQTVNIDPGIATARNFSILNVNHNPTFQGGNQLKIYGSLKLSRLADWSFGGSFYFEATTSGHTITTDSIVISNHIYFQGIGGSWTLLDNLECQRDIILSYGTLNTNNKTVECNGFSSTSNNFRSLSLGTSAIRVGYYWSLNLQNLTFNAGQSLILFKNNGYFSSTGTGPAIYHTVWFLGDGTATGNNNYDTLRLSKGKSYVISGNSVLSKRFEAVGTCVQVIDIRGIWHFSMPATAQFMVEYCKIRDVNASGGANFTAYESNDNGNNTGITFAPLTPYNLYWVGSSGDWNDTAHWSYTSGGPGGACIPRSIDNVWFDANSFITGDSVVIDDVDAECHNMTWTNIAAAIRLAKYKDLYIYGSVWLHNNLIWDGISSQTFFVSDQTGETITSDSVKLTGPVFFDGDGSWTLQDDFYVNGHGVEHVKGIWNTNNKNVTVYVYHSYSGLNRTLTLGSSLFIVQSPNIQAWTLGGNNYTLNAGTSTIDISAPNAGMYNTSTFNFNFYNVIFSNSQGLAQLNTDINYFYSLTFNSNGFIRGNNTYGTLNFTKGKDYSLAYLNTQTIVTNLNAIGGCDGYILIHSDHKDTISFFHKVTGTINCDYLIMWNIHASGGATFNASNSVDLGNNSGWNFTSPLPKNLYWVGGTGNWSDVNHWSYTSGGPGGACVPSPLDSVFFDKNSFVSVADTVNIDLTNATCHTMTWKDTLQGAILDGMGYSAIWFWGSVIFDTTMVNIFQGKAWFEAPDTGHIIVSAGQWFNESVIFDGRGGSWTIVDSLYVRQGIELRHGALFAAEKIIQASTFKSVKISSRTLDITNTLIRITGSEHAWEIVHDSLTFMTAGSEIIFTSPGFVDFYNYSNIPGIFNYHNVSFLHYHSYAALLSIGANVVINVAYFGGNGTFNSSFVYDSIIMTGGHTYRFNGNTTQTFNHIFATGTCYQPIVFTNADPLNPGYYLHSLSPSAQVSYVTMKDCHGVLPATYNAINSFDDGGNVNWIITPVAPVDLYWVNGTGNWWDPMHWSYSSGGPGGACIPTWRDNVFFDQNSFVTSSDSVFVDSLFAECHDMQWLNITSNPTFILPAIIPLEIHGSLRLVPAINGQFIGRMRFLSTHAGNYIYCGSQSFHDSVVFLGNSGAWTLYDSLVAMQTINLISGSLNTNGQTVTAARFISMTNDSRQLSLGSSLFKVNSIWRLNGQNLVFNAGQSHITLAASNAQMINENGQGFVYHNVSFLGTVLTLTCTLRCNTVPVHINRLLMNTNGRLFGEHIFDSLLFMPGNLYQLEKGKIQTVLSYWLLRGNNCFPLTLQSTEFGQQATVVKTSGSVVGDFLHIRDIEATGGATFYAGDNSSNVANNTGWTFNNSPGYIFGLGPDIEFTIGTSITLTTVNFNAGPGTTFLWSTGATTPSIIVSQPDTYSVTVTYAGNCIVVDTIIIFCNVKPNYDIGHCICFGDSNGWINMTIQDTVGVYSAIWSHGANQLNVSGLSAGQYIVTIIGSTGCKGQDTLWIHQPPKLIVPLDDTSFCEDDTGVLLDASSAFVKFWWNGQPGGQTLFVNKEDTIVVIVEDADGCQSDPDTIVVTIDTIPFIWLGDDADICLGDELLLTPGYGFDSYLWQDGSSKPEFVATQGGTYHVKIKLRTCINHDTILLFDCPPLLIFPNVFTPNGDSYNEHFFPVHQNIINYRLVVYNRWGAVVFESDDPDKKWDGTTKSLPCPEGTYFYSVDYAGFGQKAMRGSQVHRGVLTILR